jgi:hypothetical protein
VFKYVPLVIRNALIGAPKMDYGARNTRSAPSLPFGFRVLQCAMHSYNYYLAGFILTLCILHLTSFMFATLYFLAVLEKLLGEVGGSASCMTIFPVDSLLFCVLLRCISVLRLATLLSYRRPKGRTNTGYVRLRGSLVLSQAES